MKLFLALDKVKRRTEKTDVSWCPTILNIIKTDHDVKDIYMNCGISMK